jgi:hypothetical protein
MPSSDLRSGTQYLVEFDAAAIAFAVEAESSGTPKICTT